MNDVSIRQLLRGIDGLLPESPTFRVLAGQRVSGKFYGATITSALQTLRDPASGKLVLNVHERLLHAVLAGHGAFFGRVLGLIDVPPARIVIDIPPLQSPDLRWLKGVVESYRRAGFGIAIEASSAVQAKLWATLVRPDWIRLRPALIAAETVAELRALGSKVVATRVEDALAHARSVAAGVDLVQGFHYDTPSEAF